MISRVQLIFSIASLFVLQGNVDQAAASCPATTPMVNFNPTNFIGTWYAIQRYKVLIDALATSCTTLNTTLSNQNVASLELCGLFRQRAPLRILGVLASNGVVNFKFRFGLGLNKIFLFFLILLFKFDVITANWEFRYIIVDTDYANYAVTYLCGTGPAAGTVEIAWIFSRQRTLSNTYVQTAINALKAKGLNTKSWETINQNGCT